MRNISLINGTVHEMGTGKNTEKLLALDAKFQTKICERLGWAAEKVLAGQAPRVYVPKSIMARYNIPDGYLKFLKLFTTNPNDYKNALFIEKV